MEINTPDSEKFAESMERLGSEDFMELIVEPQEDERAMMLDYLETEQIRRLSNEQILETINQAVERAEMYFSKADDCQRLVELLSKVLIDERGSTLEDEL